MSAILVRLLAPLVETLDCKSTISSTLSPNTTFAGEARAPGDLTSAQSPARSSLLIGVVTCILGISCYHFIKRTSIWTRFVPRSSKSNLPRPPIVNIPRDILLSEAGHDAYNKALDEHGDVIVVPRHGKLEYIIEHQHAQAVLTDSHHYSFEQAVVNVLRMEFMLWFKGGTFVQELDTLVQEGVTPRLKAVVAKVAPVFADELRCLRERQEEDDRGDTPFEISDPYHWVHRSIAHAMVILILGEEYVSPDMVEHFMAIVAAITRLAAIYQNTEGWRYFPGLWSLKTTLSAILFTIIPRFCCGVMPRIWRRRQVHLAHAGSASRNEYAAFFDVLVSKHGRRDGNGDLRLSVINFAWCAIICLGIIFASVHQTAVVAVWCIMTLVHKQQEYLAPLREEWEKHVSATADGQYRLNIDALNELSLLDSFIKEVMRTKGDTFAPVRYTVREVQIGPYIIPKGAVCLIYVRRVHEHADNYGAEGRVFDGFRWQRDEKPAVQSTSRNVSFGLGRWACPGRFLAIAEIKMVMLALFFQNDVQLREHTYRVSDPMNATSVAPEGVLQVSARNLSSCEGGSLT